MRGTLTIMKIAVVSDSTAYIPKELIEKYNIYTIPLSVGFGDDFYREEVDISVERFYEKVKEASELPTTSQPSLGSFVQLYESLAEQYDTVISIHLSKQLSGTYEASISAGKMVDNLDVFSFDSAISAMPQGFYVLEAAEMVKQGKSIDEIMDRLNVMKETMIAYFMVDDLSHLQRGGRLSGAQALVGSLLRIKPILHIVEGKIIPFDKVRTRKRALQRIMSLLEKDLQEHDVKRIVFTHANNPEVAKELQQTINEKYPQIETVFSDLGPVVGTHLGEGAIGVGWYTS